MPKNVPKYLTPLLAQYSTSISPTKAMMAWNSTTAPRWCSLSAIFETAMTEDCDSVGRSAEEEGDRNRVSYVIEDNLKEVGKGVDADARRQEHESIVSR